MDRIRLRNLVFGAVGVVLWVAMAHAQQPMPPGPPPLPRIVTPDDPPPATNPTPATNPQSGSTPDAATNVIPPANPARGRSAAGPGRRAAGSDEFADRGAGRVAHGRDHSIVESASN